MVIKSKFSKSSKMQFHLANPNFKGIYIYKLKSKRLKPALNRIFTRCSYIYNYTRHNNNIKLFKRDYSTDFIIIIILLLSLY